MYQQRERRCDGKEHNGSAVRAEYQRCATWRGFRECASMAIRSGSAPDCVINEQLGAATIVA